MRRIVSIAMVIFGISMIITGIMKLFSPFDDMTFPPHIINSIAFGVFSIIHVWLNWKPVVRYFKGLGWYWVLVAAGVFLVAWSTIVAPIRIVTG